MSIGKFRSTATSSDDYVSSDYPNPLDEFDSPSYNLKFYMASDDAVKNNDIFNSNSQYIIAQDGLTEDVSIESFTVDHVYGFNNFVRAGTSIAFKLKLRQLMGADLIDRFHVASDVLGVSNYLKATYFMELTFKGRDRVYGESNNNILSKKWLWRIIITSVKVGVDGSGSTYDITGVTQGDIAYTNQTDLSRATNITAKTLGEYFTSLGDTLNGREEDDKPKTLQTVPDKYVFVVDPLIADFKIGSSNDAANSSNSTEYNNLDVSAKEVTFVEGTSITDLIINVCSSSYQMQQLAKNQATAEKIDIEKAQERSKVFKKMIKVHTDVTFGEYDSGRGNYSKNITYYIKVYDIARLILQQGETVQTTESMQMMLDTLKSEKYLRKVYNYIYTGQNDQVLDVDIKFNTAWYLPLPREGGKDNISNNTNGITTSNGDKDEDNDAKKKRSQTMQLAASGTDPSTSETDAATVDTIHKAAPVSYQEGNINDLVATGTEAMRGSGEAAFSVLFSQAIDSADLIELKLTVRGDPDYLQRPIGNKSAFAPKDINDMENYEKGEQYVLFRYKMPIEYDEVTGVAKVGRESAVFSGVYGVIGIEHRFKGGTYTQVMTLIRHKLIEVDKIKK